MKGESQYICIAPYCRQPASKALKGSHSFTCTPTRLSADGLNHTCIHTARLFNTAFCNRHLLLVIMAVFLIFVFAQTWPPLKCSLYEKQWQLLEEKGSILRKITDTFYSVTMSTNISVFHWLLNYAMCPKKACSRIISAKTLRNLSRFSKFLPLEIAPICNKTTLKYFQHLPNVQNNVKFG